MEKFKKIDDLILEHINVTKFGFQHSEYMLDCNTGIFYRETENKYDVLNYGFGYDYRFYDPLTMCKEAINSYISFKSVEKILNAILPNPDNLESFSNSWEFFFYCQETLTNKMKPDINSPEELTHETVFKNDQILIENIKEAVSNMNIYIEQNHLTFFDEFITVQDLNDKILEKYDWMNWAHFFFKKPFFKAIIIMKLCNNNKKYDDFTKMYKARIANGIQEGRNDLVPYYQDFIKIMHYLEDGKYKELAI